jgi:hypothetical protein
LTHEVSATGKAAQACSSMKQWRQTCSVLEDWHIRMLVTFIPEDCKMPRIATSQLQTAIWTAYLSCRASFSCVRLHCPPSKIASQLKRFSVDFYLRQGTS